MSRLLAVGSRSPLHLKTVRGNGAGAAVASSRVVVLGTWTRDKGSDAITSSTTPPVSGFRGLVGVCAELSKARLR